MEGPGKLIVFEGVDHSGKSTQARLLQKYLREHNYNAELITFPDRTTTIGRLLDSYLKCIKELPNEAVHLLFSANRWELSSQIKNYITEGTYVIIDRYYYSGIAYSMAKGLSYEWCCRADIGLPKPDIVFYLHLDLDLPLLYKHAERYENINMQKKVLNCYDRLRNKTWETINANQPIIDVHTSIIKRVRNLPTHKSNCCII